MESVPEEEEEGERCNNKPVDEIISEHLAEMLASGDFQVRAFYDATIKINTVFEMGSAMTDEIRTLIQTAVNTLLDTDAWDASADDVIAEYVARVDEVMDAFRIHVSLLTINAVALEKETELPEGVPAVSQQAKADPEAD